MQIQQMSDDFFVSGQIHPEQIDAIAKQGFKSVICNRPDGEVMGQPHSDQVLAAASEAGLEIRHIPVTHGALGLAEIEGLLDAIKSMPGPILAYCNSGARSAALFGIVSDY